MDPSSQLTEPAGQTAPQGAFLRLSRIEVDDLFGVYDHRIDLNLESNVTLLHGPNGVGKTVLLRMINAVLSGRMTDFPQIPFSRFLIQFHEDSFIEITRGDRSQGAGQPHLRLVMDGIPHESVVRLTSEAEHIAAQVKFLKSYEGMHDAWVDVRDGEFLSSDEVVARYREFTPRFPASDIDDVHDREWFRAFQQRVNSYLIQEQRLFHVSPRKNAQLRSSRYSTGFVSTVIDYSQDFQSKLAQSMAEYGRQSQALDQSFPQRLIAAQAEMSVADLQSELEKIEKKTADFMKIGVLEEAHVNPLSAGELGNIDPAKALVMALYVKDAKSKLSALDDLANRSRLLFSNVNQKYQNKRIRLDRDRGLVAESDSHELLALDSLSSGEQHELVVHYDLLFNVPSDTIVLIDEPELSLHVGWQKRFLPDLLEIVKVSGLDVLIATHSPYIVGDRDDLMVPLGDVD